MAKSDVSVRVPSIVADNLHQLIERQNARERRKPFYLHLTGPVAKAFGTLGFLWLNILVFAVWITMNTSLMDSRWHFDPYPFGFLTLTVSLEAIVLTILVLISQNELQRDADERAELDLHINLLSERESTSILRKLQRIEEHLKIPVGEDERKYVEELVEDTNAVDIAETIRATSGRT